MTNTDTMWTDRLKAVMPDNFLTNGSTAYTPGQNEILTSMINRIGRTVVNGTDNPMNPFDRYTKPIMEFGDTLQEYKIPYSKAQKYDAADTNPYSIVKNEPKALYFKIDDSCQYQNTIYNRQFKKAFATQGDFDAFVSAQLESMQTADALDKRTKWKEYISQDGIAGKQETIDASAMTDADYGEALLRMIRKYTDNLFREPSTAYNAMGDMAISTDVDVIMKREDAVNMDMDVLAGIYNLDKVGIKADILMVDDFATPASDSANAGNELVAVIADRRALAYTPTMQEASTAYNAKGLYTNYFYTVEGVYSVSKYRNMVQVFKKAAA